MKEVLEAISTIYITLLFLISLCVCLSANDNYANQTEQERWESICVPMDKVNYIFPAQIIGCWLASPIQEGND